MYEYIYACYGRIDCLLTSYSRKKVREEREGERERGNRWHGRKWRKLVTSGEWRVMEGSAETASVAVEDGRLFYLEMLEAHLNSGCVSPALADCYLL